MQILPQTANYLTKHGHNTSQLNDPKRNIALGAQYLGYLSDKVTDSIVLRTAAYNAGWQNVQKWLPLDAMPLEQWIELIPFKETREYVKAVIAYERIYAQQLNQLSAIQPINAEEYVSYTILTSNLETGTLSAR
jgi:soluble lytic murein transglycosylase